MPKELNGWELSAEGNIIVFPLTGYSMQTAAGMTVMLQVQYAKPGDPLSKPSGRLPLVLTPAIAVELAQALQHGASKIVQSRRPNSAANS